MKKILLSVFLLSSMNLFAQGGWGTNGGQNGTSTWTGGGMTASGGVYQAPPRPHSGYMMPLGMNEMQFRNLKSSISRQAFDDTRLSIAKQGIRSTGVSAAQVRELASLLTFERNKLTFAIYAYNFCVDPSQYYVVNDAFVFNSSIDELNRELGLDRPIAGGSCGTGTYGNNGYYGNSHGGGGHGHGNGNGHGHGNHGGANSCSPNGHGHGHGHNGGSCGMIPVSSGEFCQIKSSIEKQWFDSERLTVAKQITRAKLLTSSQVTEIMGLFSFESTKLDFAKFAYGFVYDPENYFIVNDGFTFSSSVEELQEYIYRF